MNWEQKAAAIQALVGYQNFAIRMRRPQDWYVQTTGLERKEGGCLSSGCENGKTPEEAIEQCWEWMMCKDDPAHYLVLNAYRDNRRAVRWNGFMWEEVSEG